MRDAIPRLTPTVWKSSSCVPIVSAVIVTGAIAIVKRKIVVKPKQHGRNAKDRPIAVPSAGTLVEATLPGNVAGRTLEGRWINDGWADDPLSDDPRHAP